MKIKKKVAIVEDNPGIRSQLVKIITAAADMECLAAVKSAELALEKIPPLRPEIVLMDIKLPGMSGIECIPLLKQKLPDMEILILSIYEEEDQVYNALKAGANGYLVKSSEPDTLLAAIRDIYFGGTPFSPHIARKVVRYFRQPVTVSAASPGEETLAPREFELLELVAAGCFNSEIAERMGITFESVRTYIKRIYAKLHVRNRTEAVLRHLQRKKHS
ncbi:MAG: response regulator transcription factor [Verrucomicrobiales bacterium]|nr:response regulator transcription factor [Verrucomicrobiales bacterium]